MARSARTTLRSADLASEFGIQYATKLFGEDAIASLPLRQAGKNKGKPKGFLIWLRTDEAGWHINAGEAVPSGTTVRAWIGAGPLSSESDALRGHWLGRVQGLCGSRVYLGAAARERFEAEAARDRAEFEAACAAREAA